MRIWSFVIIVSSVLWCGCVRLNEGATAESPVAQKPRPVHIVGRVSGNVYISPRGGFAVPFPVSPEFGGRIIGDDPQSVTFHDDRGVRIAYYSLAFNAQSPMMAVLRKDGRQKALETLVKDNYGNSITPHYHPDVRDGTISLIYVKPVGTQTAVAAFVHQNRVFLAETDLPPGVQFLSKQDDLTALDEKLENSAVDLIRSMETR
jgi:hypothetical protein